MNGLGYRLEKRDKKFFAIYNFKGYSSELEVPENMIETYVRTITYSDNPTPVADVDRTGDEGFIPNVPIPGDN